MNIAVFVPEWPGQTHTWVWREAKALRDQGLGVFFVSTRRPPARDAAKHDFVRDPGAATSYLWPCGAGSLAWGVVRELARGPWRFLSAAAWCLGLPLEGGKRWRRGLGSLALGCRLAGELRARRAGFVHVHSLANSAVIALVAGRLTGVPCSIAVNANLDWWGGAVEEKLRAASLVVLHAGWLREAVLARCPWIDASRVILAPVGVDTREWMLVDRPEAGGALRLVSVGRLHESKGHDVAVRAVGLLRRGGVEATLRILGAGPDEERLAALIGELGLSGVVTLAGSVSEARVREELAGAGVFVLMSHAEPLGVVYMEAMATGIPTVGTRAGGVPEIIEDGVSGYLVEPGSAEGLAGALRRLVADPGSARAVGLAGRARIEAKFDSRLGAALVARAMRSVVGEQEGISR